MKMDVATLACKGQLTILQDIREKMRLKQDDEVLFVEETGRIIPTVQLALIPSN